MTCFRRWRRGSRFTILPITHFQQYTLQTPLTQIQGKLTDTAQILVGNMANKEGIRCQQLERLRTFLSLKRPNPHIEKVLRKLILQAFQTDWPNCHKVILNKENQKRGRF
jgi:phosphoenolpyruvate carboxylase